MCIAACDDLTTDSDADGLTDCEEACIGSDSMLVDTDGDGMADGFEHEYGLDVLADDAAADLDGDTLSNLDEFFRGSAPDDISSPTPVFVVAPDGDDETGDGTLASPWQSIGYALGALDASADAPARLIVQEGIYTEDFTLPEGLTLVGAPKASVTITGRIVGAPGAVIKDVTLTPGANAAYILDMNDVAMTLNRVIFEGTEARDHTGVLIDGMAPAASVFEYCTFTSLGVGLDVGDALPTVRRCVFDDFPVTYGPDDARAAAIYIRDNGREGEDWRSIGEESDPANGWNDFLPSIEGFAVINERSDAVTMQNNYWGVTDPSLFPSRVNGAAVVLPILQTHSAILASSIHCAVWDTRDQKRIENGAISLQVSPFGLEERNDNGVYSFLCVEDGSYSVTVEAEGYAPYSTNVTVGAGEIKSLGIPLSALDPDSDPLDGTERRSELFAGCNAVNGTLTAGVKRYRSDAFLLALSLVTLLGWGRLSR